jgi:hypothetical protein
MAQRENALKLASDVRTQAGLGLRNKSVRVKEEVLGGNVVHRVVIEPSSNVPKQRQLVPIYEALDSTSAS